MLREVIGEEASAVCYLQELQPLFIELLEGCVAAVNPIEFSKGWLRHGVFSPFCYSINIDDWPTPNAGRRRLQGLVRRGAPRVVLPPPRSMPLSGSSAHAYRSTSSASTRRCGGIVIASACAVFRLITHSNVVGCSTGSSAGCAPLRILSTNLGASR